MSTSRVSANVLPGIDFNAESGSLQLWGAAAQLYRSWETLLTSLLIPYATETVVSPGLVSAQLMDDSGYAENFPQQLVAVLPSGFLPPAACLALYPLLQQRTLPASMLVTARCGRNEDHRWEPPFRLRAFTMMELVLAGPARQVAALRDELIERVSEKFSRLNLPGQLVAATDAFFLGEQSGARMMQRLKELKREYVTAHDRVPRVVLWSINNHERYFTSRFALGDDDTESTCLAFGLERLTAAGLLLWGPQPDRWPQELRP
jgi:hypothetical protein